MRPRAGGKEMTPRPQTGSTCNWSQKCIFNTHILAYTQIRVIWTISWCFCLLILSLSIQFSHSLLWSRVCFSVNVSATMYTTNIHIISWVVECFYGVTALQVSDKDNGQKVLWQVKVHLIQLGATGEAEAVHAVMPLPPSFLWQKAFWWPIGASTCHTPHTSASGHCSSRVEELEVRLLA